MAAQTREEEQRKRRRRRLVQGLVMGGAAVGLPALMNALVSRRARRLPAPTWGEGEVYDHRHGRVVYQRIGDGPPLLLLHSFGPGHSAAEWRRTAERLALHAEVHVPDLLGWGRSDRPAMTYDGELYIQLVTDFLAEVIGAPGSGPPATIVAAGLPAAYAVQVAADQPELVRALALVVPLGIGLHGDEPDVKDAVVHRLLRLPVLGTSALNLYTTRSGLAGYLRREVYASPTLVDDALVENHYRNSHQPGAHAPLAAFLSGYLNHGVREVLSRLELPVWIAWGRQAVSPAVETADLWLRDLDRPGFEVLEHCGILPHAEAPEEFSRKLERFLSKLRD